MFMSNVVLSTLTAFLLLSIGGNWAAAEDTTKCGSCKKLVEDFQEGKRNTARNNFAGGDVSWEEEKRLSYATSETRLIEILENVCVKDHKCQQLLEYHEEAIETWWLEKQVEHPDLHKWLCVQQVKVCCASGTYGKQCAECPGGAASPCGGRGKCDGDGDRQGKGTCGCNEGYAGSTCAACSAGYFNGTAADTEEGQCRKCAAACEKNCTGPGADACEDCAEGYEEQSGMCADHDECGQETPPCRNLAKTYCLNTQGSYQCASCHAACNASCTGAGAETCDVCAPGYTRDDTSAPCADFDECKDHQSRWLPPPRPEDPNTPYPGCNFSTYCHNTEGSFECRDCDAACDGCSVGGRESCLKCASGYTWQDKTCSDVNECEDASACNAELEVCVNTDGSFRCDCASGRKRVNSLCPPKPKPSEDTQNDDDDENEDDNDGDTAAKKDEL